MNEFKQLLSAGVATKALGLSSSTLVEDAPNASQITQTYTQDAQSKAPILPEGSTEEKKSTMANLSRYRPNKNRTPVIERT